jgi:hypothetical protein
MNYELFSKRYEYHLNNYSDELTFRFGNATSYNFQLVKYVDECDEILANLFMYYMNVKRTLKRRYYT